MKFSPKKAITGIGIGLAATIFLSGCQSTETSVKTDVQSYSSDQLIAQYNASGDANVIKPVVQQANMELIKQYYGNRDVDASKLLTRAKNQYGPTYLESIATQSQTEVKTDDDAKKALEYMEHQKMFLEERTDTYITDNLIRRQHFAGNTDIKPATFSVQHVLVKTLEEAKTMQADLVSGKVDFAKLETASKKAKSENKTSTTATNKIEVMEAATYNKQAIGTFAYQFENAAFSQKEKEWGTPVLTAFGYHVIYVKARDTYTISDDVKKSLTESLKTQITTAQGASFNAAFDYAMIQFSKEHNFKMSDDKLNEVLQKYYVSVEDAYVNALSTSTQAAQPVIQ